jgi:hypothetical protein
MYVDQAAKDAAAGHSTINQKEAVASFWDRQMAWARSGWNQTELPATPVGDTITISRALQSAVGHGALASV